MVPPILIFIPVTALRFASSFTARPSLQPRHHFCSWERKTTGTSSTRCMDNGSTSVSATYLQQRSRDGKGRSSRTAIYNFRSDDGLVEDTSNEGTKSWPLIAIVGTISFVYWYWLVFGALASSQGLPLVPDWLPLTPGWPPSDADLEPVLADSQNFFYLSTLLQNMDAPYVQPVRLAAFNLAEAWIFAFLPLLWADGKRRLNKWGLLATWAFLGVNLTNAFLAPYIFLTELNSNEDLKPRESYKSSWVSTSFGVISTLVACYAALQCATTATASDWSEMGTLIQTDRTYMAFGVDLCLFSLFQPLLISRVRQNGQPRSTDYVPFLGLMAWLYERDQ